MGDLFGPIVAFRILIGEFIYGRPQDFVLKEDLNPLSCGKIEISLDKQLRFSYTKLRKVRLDESRTYI
jgi:hypothetical protein